MPDHAHARAHITNYIKIKLWKYEHVLISLICTEIALLDSEIKLIRMVKYINLYYHSAKYEVNCARHRGNMDKSLTKPSETGLPFSSA